MNDGLKITGEVSIRGYNEQGEQVLAIDKSNLVVTAGKQRMAALLATGNADYLIDGIGFGTGASSPTLSDTGLTSALIKDIGDSSFPTANSVMFDWALEFAEYNGNTIREIGLFSGVAATEEQLFARIVTDAIAKTSGLRLEGTWKITF
jgi:hypothetical protein